MISVVIPCYNYARYLSDCVRSCLLQTVQPHEIIIVDDASTDNSAEVAWHLRSRELGVDISVRRLNHNQGVSAARNVGIDGAMGNLIVLLDADDMLTPRSIEWRLNAMKTGINMVHGYALKFRGDKRLEWCVDNMKKLRRSPKVKKQYVHAQGQMFRKEVLLKYPFPEKLTSKEDKAHRVMLGLDKEAPYGPRIKAKYIDRPVAFYRRHQEAKHKRRLADKEWRKNTDRIYREFKNELVH